MRFDIILQKLVLVFWFLAEKTHRGKKIWRIRRLLNIALQFQPNAVNIQNSYEKVQKEGFEIDLYLLWQLLRKEASYISHLEETNRIQRRGF
jgi:hypothetical protein